MKHNRENQAAFILCPKTLMRRLGELWCLRWAVVGLAHVRFDIIQPPPLQFMRLMVLEGGFMNADWNVTLGFSSGQLSVAGIVSARDDARSLPLGLCGAWVPLAASAMERANGVTNLYSPVPILVPIDTESWSSWWFSSLLLLCWALWALLTLYGAGWGEGVWPLCPTGGEGLMGPASPCRPGVGCSGTQVAIAGGEEGLCILHCCSVCGSRDLVFPICSYSTPGKLSFVIGAS